MAIQNGQKLLHIQAPNYVNEFVDQVVGLGMQAGDEKFAITFGRDQLQVTHETYKVISENAYQTLLNEDGFTVNRLDFATLTMSIGTATRLRDMLTDMINNAVPTQINSAK